MIPCEDCSDEEQIINFTDETSTCTRCGKIHDLRDDDYGIEVLSALCLAALVVFVVMLTLLVWL